jgi:ketosteroid isomerase-like protein
VGDIEAQKAIVRDWAERAGSSDRWHNFAPDFEWTMIGTTPVSGLMVGARGVAEQMAPFGARMAKLEVTIDALIGEGDTVVKIAHSDGLTKDGTPYRNQYATTFRFEDGKVVEVVEYLDTALIETAVFGRTLSDPE